MEIYDKLRKHVTWNINGREYKPKLKWFERDCTINIKENARKSKKIGTKQQTQWNPTVKTCVWTIQEDFISLNRLQCKNGRNNWWKTSKCENKRWNNTKLMREKNWIFFYFARIEESWYDLLDGEVLSSFVNFVSDEGINDE